MSSDEVGFSQEYFVYYKKQRQNQGSFFPEDAEGKLCGAALSVKMILGEGEELFLTQAQVISTANRVRS